MVKAVRQPSPQQESVEIVSAIKDRVPVASLWSAHTEAPETEAHPAGAVDLLRMRVAALRGEDRDSAVAMSDGDGEMLGLLSRFFFGGGDAASPRAVWNPFRRTIVPRPSPYCRGSLLVVSTVEFHCASTGEFHWFDQEECRSRCHVHEYA